MVDHIDFREFVGSFQHLFKIISRNTLKRDIFKIYDNEREKVLKITDKNGSRMAITTDMWTLSNKKRRFMVITAYFIDHTWTLQSRVLIIPIIFLGLFMFLLHTQKMSLLMSLLIVF